MKLGVRELSVCYIVAVFSFLGVFSETVPEVEEFKRQNPDLSEFLDLCGASPQFNSAVEWKIGTLFAPTNAAIQEFKNKNPNILNNFTLLYHYANTPKMIGDLEESSLFTELPGNLPIWVTKMDSDVFLNGAKIIRADRKLRLGKNQFEQIVHSIDSVLEPTIPTSNVMGSPRNNPDAKKFLEFSADYSIAAPYNTSVFAGQVKKLNRIDLFSNPGKNTFFLPVSEAFSTTRIASVDNRTIDGHMVVGKAIFIGVNDGTTKGSSTFETSAAADNFPVVVTFEYSNTAKTWSVISDNLVDASNSKHRRVRTQILRANIPVKNGVVHLINRPLVVIDSSVYTTLKGGENGPLKKFYEVIDEYDEIKRVLSDTSKDKRVTIFAPTTSALEKSTNFKELYAKSKQTGGNEEAKKEIEEAKARLLEILKLHIVKHDIASEDIMNEVQKQTPAEPYMVKTLSEKKDLHFNVVKGKNNEEVIAVIDSTGTSAYVRQADIGATNGVIHMLDGILGIGDNTMHDRIKTEANLSLTYNLTLQGDFIRNFKSKDKMFTFFAPSNEAWEGVKFESFPKYHILFQGLHSGHVRRIMERHLIPGSLFSLEDLYSASVTGNKTVGVNTIRTIGGEVRVVAMQDPNIKNYTEKYGSGHPRKNHTRFHGDYKYVLFWENKEVRVIKGNIKCANGYIHIIDTVLMTSNDVFVNSAFRTISFITSILLTLIPAYFIL